VFVGYRLGPGGEESDQHLACSIDDVVGEKLHRGTLGEEFRYISPNATRVIEFDSESGIDFPCKVAYEHGNFALAGRVEGSYDKIDPRDPFNQCAMRRLGLKHI
jgi:hypothetical protein